MAILKNINKTCLLCNKTVDNWALFLAKAKYPGQAEEEPEKSVSFTNGKKYLICQECFGKVISVAQLMDILKIEREK